MSYTTTSEHGAWTAAGSDATAQRTYTSIKVALADLSSHRDVEVFLQGSYANTTNVRSDSDVDIVVMTKQTFQGETTRLGTEARARWDRISPATFTASDLRSEVYAALVSYYGASRVESKNKCIRVVKTDGYVDADVVPCLQYRRYVNPDPNLDSEYTEGVSITPLRGARIVNFPKEHIKWGQIKNILGDGNYKKTVRQVKRLRTRAVDLGLLPDGIAPGYLLECLTYNAPNELFENNDSTRLMKVLSWLKHADKAGFDSCDWVHKLFVNDPGDFEVAVAQQILDALWETF